MGYPDNVGDEPNEMGNTLPPIDLGVQTNVLGLDAAGGGHVCALFEDGSAKCWGSNNKGQLGQGNLDYIGINPGEVAALPPIDLDANAVDISTGSYFTCALLADQSVKCWGENAKGQLGQGDQIVRGDNPGEMGANLPAVDLGAGVVIVGIVAGVEHACAMLDDGSLKCWGANDFGQLGLGHQNDLGDGPGEMGDNLAEISFGDGLTVLAIGAGQFHTCAILSDAGVRCWGRGQALGQGNGLDISDPEGLPAVDLNGAVPVSLQCGNSLTCAVLDDGKVKCWGINGDGQLGQGNTEAKGDEPNEMGNWLLPVDLGAGVGTNEVAVATASVCARLDTNGVKCWGTNTYGQLGQGDTENRGDNFGDMGDNLPEINLE
jgi:alpha-tubulin suppressor-like RCC1 family protein